MDRTTAERIMKEACERHGVTYRQDTPEDSIYQDGPRISFINQSGTPTTPSAMKKDSAPAKTSKPQQSY